MKTGDHEVGEKFVFEDTESWYHPERFSSTKMILLDTVCSASRLTFKD
jgi:hypothetical protein